MAWLDAGHYITTEPVRVEFLFCHGRDRVNMIDLSTVEKWFNDAPNKKTGRSTWAFYWRFRAPDGRRGCVCGDSRYRSFRTYKDFKAWFDLLETRRSFAGWSNPPLLDREPQSSRRR